MNTSENGNFSNHSWKNRAGIEFHFAVVVILATKSFYILKTWSLKNIILPKTVEDVVNKAIKLLIQA